MITFRHWRVAASISALAVLLVFGSGNVAPAVAQLAPYGGQQDVLVDMSAVGSGNGAPQNFGSVPGYSGDLLAAPAQAPRSQLLVSAPPTGNANAAQTQEGRITLTPPRPAAAPRTKPSTIRQKPERKVAAAKPKPVATARVSPTPRPKAAPPKPAIQTPKPQAKPETASVEPKKPVPSSENKPAPLSVRAPPPPTPSTEQPPPLPKVTPPKPAVMEAKEPSKSVSAPEQASRTPPPETSNQGATVAFGPDAATLPSTASSVLDGVLKRLNSDANLRLQLQAYAGGPSLSPSKARRLSLSRALAVRSYLIDGGIRSSRIDVRALGDKVPDGDPNRVDIHYTKR